MNVLEVFDRRLVLLEEAVYRLCATLSAQPGAVDEIGQNLAQQMQALRAEVMAAPKAAPSIILPPH